MKKLDKRFLTLLLSLAVLLPSLLLFAGCDPFTILHLSMACRPDPPTPEITSAEFPFKLVYIIDGEEVVYEDVITCTYDGFNNDASRSDKYRVWSKEYAKDSLIVLSRLNDEQVIYFCIQYSAAYLMGETPDAVNYYDDPPFVGLGVKHEFYNGEIGYRYDRTLEADELKEVYNIEIVSFEMPPPIENTFIPVE